MPVSAADLATDLALESGALVADGVRPIEYALLRARVSLCTREGALLLPLKRSFSQLLPCPARYLRSMPDGLTRVTVELGEIHRLLLDMLDIKPEVRRGRRTGGATAVLWGRRLALG